MKIMDDEPIILLMYVDDVFLNGNEKQIKYALDGSKARFVARGFYQREELIMKRHLLQEARYTSIRTIMALASMMYTRWM